MNWLAHLLLSGPDPAMRIGGLLPDLLPAPLRGSVDPLYHPGMRRHQRVDAFTDSHPLVRAGWKRFAPEHRHYAGMLSDVFFDHVLTRDWHLYSPQPLAEFVAGFHASIADHRAGLPAAGYERLEHIRDSGLLTSYGTTAGIHLTLQRISGRMRRPVDLGLAMTVLERDGEAFHADFREFFPQLRAHVEADA